MNIEVIDGVTVTTVTDDRSLGYEPLVKVVATGDFDTPIGIQVTLEDGSILIAQFNCDVSNKLGADLTSLGQSYKP